MAKTSPFLHVVALIELVASNLVDLATASTCWIMTTVAFAGWAHSEAQDQAQA
jgi:hypothetical protein